jgi:lysozyme
VDITKLKAELARDEGLRLKPYLDSVRKLTIGYGRNLTDVGISLEEAAYLLDADVARAVKDLDDALPWWIKLDEVRQRVLVNLTFNVGIFGVLGFVNTLKFIETGLYEAAADAMMKSLWANQVGPRAVRLAEMMRTGKEPQST